jgi:hypothetical protein
MARMAFPCSQHASTSFPSLLRTAKREEHIISGPLEQKSWASWLAVLEVSAGVKITDQQLQLYV